MADTWELKDDYQISSSKRKGVNSNFKSLRFPQEVGGEEVPAYIRFVPKEAQFGKLENYGNAVGNSGGSVFASNSPTSGFSVVGGRIPSLGGNGSGNSITSPNWSINAGPLNINIKNPIGGIVQNLAKGAEDFISNLTGGLLTANISTLFSNSASTITGRVDITQALNLSQKMNIGQTLMYSNGSINLFLPHNLKTNSSVSTGDTALGAGGAAAVSAVRDMIASTGVADAGGNFLSGVGNILGNTLVEYTAKNDKLRTGIAITEGVVANNFSYAVFKSVTHRKFDYSFKMIAKNEKESEEIKQICDMFLYYMLPNKINTNTFSFFEVPAMWEIKYMYQGNELAYHLQPKNSFLTNVNITYGGESLNSLYNNGAPVEVQIDLNFIEIEPLYRQ
jgi:hypothetical protein